MNFLSILAQLGIDVNLMRALPLLKYKDKKPGEFTTNDLEHIIETIGLETDIHEELISAAKAYLTGTHVSKCLDSIVSPESMFDFMNILLYGVSDRFKLTKPVITFKPKNVDDIPLCDY